MRALPVAKANITSAVSAVQPMPSGLGLGWWPATGYLTGPVKAIAAAGRKVSYMCTTDRAGCTDRTHV